MCFLGDENRIMCVVCGRRVSGKSLCDNDMTDGVGFPRFIPVLLRRGFRDTLAADGNCVAP